MGFNAEPDAERPREGTRRGRLEQEISYETDCEQESGLRCSFFSNLLVLPVGLDIVPYEGKDALKNSILLKFIIDKFQRVLVTFDLDAKAELERTMTQVGLEDGKGYLPVGSSKPGKQCIEGLLPERVLSRVYSANTDLVMALTSADSKERKSAKSSLKQRLLAEFKSDKTIARDDLKSFMPVFKALSKLTPGEG